MTEPNTPPTSPEAHLAERMANLAQDAVIAPPSQSAEAPTEAPTKPAEPAEPATPEAAAKSGTSTPLWLTLLLVLVLAGEPFALRRFLPEPAPTPPAPAAPAVDPSRVAEVEAKLSEALRRIDALEHATPMTALAPYSTPSSTSTSAAEKSTDDAGRIQALEARLAALEARPVAALPDVEGKISAANAALNARLADMDAAIKKDVTQATERAAFANRLRTAFLSLEAGKPLGAIPDAPPALSRFADTAPPTEPALRLSFARYADAARGASQPGSDLTDPVDRAWERVKGLITIRQGDKVIVGNRTASIIEDARGRLDVGDLEGAVAGLAGLDAQAKSAMGPWLAQAQSLLDARAALLALAAKS